MLAEGRLYDLGVTADQLRITEVFFSIQGESSWVGLPCVFVRLTGCHLRCHYCDTEYAFKEGRTRSIDDLVAEIRAHPTNLVEVTGGEPLLQPGVHPLMKRLCDDGCTVLVETSGACDISQCDPRVIRILDLKTPGSGEVDRNDMENLQRLTGRDEVKFVITDREDFDWAADVIDRHRLADRCNAVLLSPVFEQAAGAEIAGAEALSPQTLAGWMLASPACGERVRLQLQLHKFIWHPQTRGV